LLKPSHLGVAACLLLPACAGTLYLAMDGTSPRPPAEVFDCARSQVAALGYNQTSFDVERQRITAQKYDWETRMADTQFRRMIERLSVEVEGSAQGGARLRLGAHTFAELATQRGPTEVERDASPAVKAAAQALMDACGK
jgi:hypothetical protein